MQSRISKLGLRALRVLLVDDNVDAVETLADLLRFEGCEVATAHDGTTGLRRVESFTPDLAILDLGLPGMDGYQLARAVRASARTRDLPLIALTAYDSLSHRVRAQEAGFDHHLAKPPNLRTLAALLEYYAQLLVARREPP